MNEKFELGKESLLSLSNYNHISAMQSVFQIEMLVSGTVHVVHVLQKTLLWKTQK